MRARTLTAVVVLAVFGAVAFAGAAIARAPAETKVTIKAISGDFSGFVSSPRPLKCAEGRKVVVYKQMGAEQDPKVDDKIASDTASLSGDRAEWNTGNTGVSGKFYARVGKTPDCKADTSKTVTTHK